VASKKKSDRAHRLAVAAQRLFHRRGLGAVSLRDVADAARVPSGGVFYHFPTKADLVIAAAVLRRDAIVDLLQGLDAQHRDPAIRLRALCEALGHAAPATARYGCAIQTMLGEVSGARGEEANAREILVDALQAMAVFVRQALREAGQPTRAAARGADDFMIRWQGAGALALSRRDKAVLLEELERLAADMTPARSGPNPK